MSSADTSLIGTMKSLFNNEDGADFRIHGQQKVFYVHKVIVNARSEYFRALTTGDMKEARDGFAKISDCEDDMLEALLLAIYTDHFDVPSPYKNQNWSEFVRKVSCLADRLLVKGLDKAFATHLKEIKLGSIFSIDCSRLRDFVDVLNTVEDEKLQEEVSMHHIAYKLKVMESPESQMIVKECPCLLFYWLKSNIRT
ncbi:MAG: hypothetical protein Q9159_005951 [Coniocarpon cinnabarinum]